MGFYQFRKEQLLHSGVDEVWDYISSPANLKDITPEYMGFDITSENLPEKMYRGMIISYRISPLPGIRVNWVTEITEIAEKKFFIDQQRIGPYAFWHHQHFIEPVGEYVLMKDIVSYKPPFGILGSIANILVIRKKIQDIFDYREMALNRRFPVREF
jgi:ligand-binding SRPBCC domain-containing protein